MSKGLSVKDEKMVLKQSKEWWREDSSSHDGLRGVDLESANCKGNSSHKTETHG